MKPRDWAALGFRLLAVYLFVQAVFGSVATFYHTVVWILSDPLFDGSHSSTFYTVFTAFFCALQAAAVGYRYWFAADRFADPRGLESDGGHAVDPMAPLMTLTVATWGAFSMLHAVRQAINVWRYQQSSLYSFSEWLENPAMNILFRYAFIHLAVVMTFALAPRLVVGVLLRCTLGARPATPESNDVMA